MMDVGCVHQSLDVDVVVRVVEVGGAVVPDGSLVDMMDVAAVRVAGQGRVVVHHPGHPTQNTPPLVDQKISYSHTHP